MKIYFRGRKFCGQKVSRFLRFWPCSRKFLPRKTSKFAKVFACEITEDSQQAKVFSIHFFSFLQSFALLFLYHCLLGHETPYIVTMTAKAKLRVLSILGRNTCCLKALYFFSCETQHTHSFIHYFHFHLLS